MAETIRKELADWFAGAEKAVLAGIGNPIRSDDYVGLNIVERLKGHVPKNVLLLEAETVPESCLLEIEEFQPSHVLLIDAAFLGLKPGEARLLDPVGVAGFSAVTTHLLPLRIFCDYIKQVTGAKIALLLIEPKSVEFGEGLTAEVQAAAERYAKILRGLFA
jgi:hydrogenase 3 maturation protease